MKITIESLRKRNVQRLIIESVDLSLYIAHAVVDGRQYLVTERSGKPLRGRNLLGMKERLADITAAEYVLLQRSAYDEMIGHAHAPGDNSMELPLGPGYETLPSWQH